MPAATSSTRSAPAPAPPSLVEALVSELLQEVGILKKLAPSLPTATATATATKKDDSHGSSTHSLIFRRMDQWMGILPCTTSINMNTMNEDIMDDDDKDEMTVEDCAPFSPPVYQ